MNVHLLLKGKTRKHYYFYKRPLCLLAMNTLMRGVV